MSYPQPAFYVQETEQQANQPYQPYQPYPAYPNQTVINNQTQNIDYPQYATSRKPQMIHCPQCHTKGLTTI